EYAYLTCGFFFSSGRRHTRSYGDWSSYVCSSDLSLGRVLERAHRPRIDIEVRIELLELHAQSARFQQTAERGGDDAFPECRHDEIGRASCRERVQIAQVDG